MKKVSIQISVTVFISVFFMACKNEARMGGYSSW